MRMSVTKTELEFKFGFCAGRTSRYTGRVQAQTDGTARSSAEPAVVVVGAGAVGQIFGHHLARAGAQVTFLVRERQREAFARGFDLYALNGFRPGAQPLRFTQFELVSSARELTGRRIDQIYVTLPSPAMDGTWLRELIAAAGSATLISLQPDAQDHALIRAAGATAESLVYGAIALVSYAAPLPGETRFPLPGTAYWLPPLARSPFSGPRDLQGAARERNRARVAEVVSTLRRGGLPAMRLPDVERALAVPNAVGMAYLTALEAAGWSERALRESELARLCARALRESLAIVRAAGNRPPPGIGLVLRPRLLGLLLWLGARLTPFPLDRYLKQHFTKVGAQTRLIVARLQAQGEAAGVEAPALAQLVSALHRLPGAT
jgi:ketopantoate reductase